MAVLSILLAVIFPLSKSLEPLSRRPELDNFAAPKNRYEMPTSTIKQLLLEKLNKFSDENSQIFEMSKPKNNYDDNLQIVDEVDQQGLIHIDRLNQSNLQSNYPSISQTSEMINPVWTDAKNIPEGYSEILNNWNQIRERQLRFQKVWKVSRSIFSTFLCGIFNST